MSRSARRVGQYVRAAALALAASLAASVAQAAPSTYTAPETKVMDPNGVDLVSGQYFRSDTFLTIGDPASGGLAWTYTGHPATDSYTGEVWYTGTAPNRYWTVKIAGTTENIATTCELANHLGCGNQNSPNFFNETTNSYTYTTGDGTVYTFKKLASDTSSSQRRGILTNILRPNGDSVTINHEHESCTSYSCNYRIKNVINNRGFAFKYEYETGNFNRLETIKAVNRADVYCDDQINSCLAYHNAITFDYPNGGVTFKVTDAMGNSTEYGTNDVNYWDTEVVSYVKQPDGWEINATYDTYGRITSLTNPEGTWNYSYSDNTLAAIQNTTTYRTVTVKDSANVQVMSAQVRKDVMMPVSVSRPGAGTLTYTIHAFTNGSSQRKWGRVYEVIQPEGNKATYTYDVRGNVTSILNTPKSGSGLSTFTLNANFDATCANAKTCNKPNWTQDAKGNYTTYTYNSTHGGVETTILPADNAGVTPKTIFGYDTFTAKIKNGPASFGDAGTIWLPKTVSTCSTAVTCDGTVNQLKTTTDYYLYQNLSPSTVTIAAGNNSLSSVTSQTFDWHGNATSVDGPLSGSGDVTYRTYDANRRPVFEIGVDPDGPPVGSPCTSGCLIRAIIKHSYDSMARETLTETGTGTSIDGTGFAQASYVVTHYNARGLKDQVTGYITGNGTPQSLSQFSYDNQGRQVCAAVRMNMAVTPPADACTLGTEGAVGPDRITRTYYDSAGRVSELWRAVGTPIAQPYARYTYANNGLKATEKDANGNLTTLEYDGFDRLKKLRYPSTTIGAGTSSTTDYEEYAYDNNGNRTYWRRRDGQVMNNCYDNLNRITIHYVHAQSGCTATGGAGDVYTSYDLTGKILSKRFASFSGSGVSYAYDGLGRVSSTTDMNGRTVGYAYNAASARISIIYPDLNTVGWGLDNANRMITVGYNGTTGLLSQGYNNLGRTTYQGKGGGATNYGYDALGRLTSMTNNVAGTTYDITWTFTYNPAGQVQTSSANSTAYDYDQTASATNNSTFDGLNRDTGIVSVGGYDARGNLTYDGAGGRTMTYDIENRLLSVVSSSVNMRLNYDPEGRLYRFSNDGGSSWTTFLYDGVNLIAEYAGTSTTPLRRYMHGSGTDNPMAWMEPGLPDGNHLQFFYPNYQGSIVATTNISGTLSALYKYDPYGVPTDINNAVNWSGSRFRYTGQVTLPAAKLYYYKARVYDPVYGRFVQTDPIGSVDDLNLYAYVAGDPVNGTDPTGTKGLWGDFSNYVNNKADKFTNWATKTSNDLGNGVAGYAMGLTQSSTNIVTGNATTNDLVNIGSYYATVATLGEAAAVNSSAIVGGTALPSTTVASTGGRLGSSSTRAHVSGVATQMESRGWTITRGGGRASEEYIPGAGGGTKGSSYPDITATKGGKTLRVNTIDTRADGVTPTTREAANAQRIRQQTGEHVLLIPKP